jgi:hypothetical protein
MKFSLYFNGIKNTIPNKEINIIDFLELIKKENKQIDLIRTLKDKNERQKLKATLSYVTFAGTFTKRGNKNLKESSGFTCFDIDDVDNLEEIKEKIIKNKYTHCLFISPSGNGLKCIVKIPQVKNDEEYKQYWISIANHYNFPENDEKAKDISRACYLTIDKTPYFNSNSEVYSDKIEVTEINKISNGKEVKKDYMPLKINSEDFLDKLKYSISMEQILRYFGVDTSRNPTNCIFHGCSQRCLSFNSEVAHCFDSDCIDKGWNIFSFVKKVKGLSSAETIEWLADFAGMNEEYLKSKLEYLNRNKDPKGWACSINIKRMAERYNALNCPKCNTPFQFNEIIGLYKCLSCGNFGGLKNFANLILNKKGDSLPKLAGN